MKTKLGQELRARTGQPIDADGVMTERDFRFLITLLLVDLAKSNGRITQTETEKMMEITQSQFQMSSAEALELLTSAVATLTDHPNLEDVLRALKDVLNAAAKEEILLLMLELIAADGQRETREMEIFKHAADVLEIAPESVHKAFERFFSK